MADTVISNTPGTRDDGAGALGWIVALIVILAIIVAGFVWVRRGNVGVPNTGSNINVQLPSTGGTGGGTGGTGGLTQ
jgi:hypothetical protein